MSDEYNEVDDGDEVDEDDFDQPIHLNFTGESGKGSGKRRGFFLLPNGKYIAEITDYTNSKASEEADNPGARIVNWEFTVESTVDGDTEIESRVKNTETKTVSNEVIKVEGRRIFDNMVFLESTVWRVMQLLDACWFDTTGEVEFRPEQMLSSRLIIEVGVQPAKKNPRDRKKQYKARNKIFGFLPLEEERPPTEESELVTVEEPSEAKV